MREINGRTIASEEEKKNKINTIVESQEEILLELANLAHFVGPDDVSTALFIELWFTKLRYFLRSGCTFSNSLRIQQVKIKPDVRLTGTLQCCVRCSNID